jgi:hypothetical protein
MKFKVNEGKIAHELIDGEVVIIQFESGNYYSLKSTGAGLWEWVVGGASDRQMLAAIPEATDERRQEVQNFLNYLVQEDLVTAVAEEAAVGAGPLKTMTSPWEKPTMDKYQDMQQLLAADPIHQVDATGWPQPLGE